jgi:hypothetical protein
VAVGEPEEIAAVRAAYDGDVLVLAPWRPEWASAFGSGPEDPHVIRTVSHLPVLRQLGGSGARIVVEVMTSMCRHGLLPEELPAAAALLDGLRVEGVALHLPMARDPLAEARTLLARVRAALPVDTAWVSHLSPAQVGSLGGDDLRVRLRSGTALWLGDRTAWHARATVLDVHRLARGTTYGYRQRRMIFDGWLLVLSGGTAHGVGMEAPKAVSGVVSRAKVLAIGTLAAAGRALSPFTIAGRQRWYAEPPHMQVSLVLLPGRVTPPAVGDEVDVDVRMTTTRFDRVTL